MKRYGAIMFLGFMMLFALSALPGASSQRMTIFNTTGNATDATGSEQVDIKDLPLRLAIPTDIVEEPRPNVTREGGNKTFPEYPGSATVVIVDGAALEGDDAFRPNPVQINRGGLVTWVNADIVTHTVTFGSGFSDPKMGEHFDSGLIGSSYKKSFDKAGEYPYFCQVHPQMVGMVIVAATEKVDVISGTNETGIISLANATAPADDETVDRPASAITGSKGSFFDGIVDFFRGLFGG